MVATDEEPAGQHLADIIVVTSTARIPASVQELSLSEIIEYIEWKNATSCRLAHDLGGHVHPEGVDGQKAVCMDPQVRPTSGNCLVYSFGISNEWSFDEAIQKLGCEVFSFDPSMNIKDHDHGAGIHFRKIGLGHRDEELDDPATKKYNWTLRSLDSIYRELGHRGRIIDYLKIDVEHAEWTALPQILKSGMINWVRQLAVEIHLPEKGGLDQFRSRAAVLRSLEEYGMIRFDSKYNPWSADWNTDVDFQGFFSYELAWWNSKLRRPDPPDLNSRHPHEISTIKKKKPTVK